MTMTMRTQRTSRRGFTLTEIAIVLGIIGLILGAIWVAASAVYNNLRISKATTELLTIAQAVRSMYATSGSADAAADMPTAFGVSTVGAANATYLAAGVFPNDVLNTGNPATATQAIDPWTGGITIVSAKALANNDSFAIEFNKVPLNACITMLVSNTGTGRDSSLYGTDTAVANTLPIAIGGAASAGNTTIPVTPSAAQAACNVAGVNANGAALAFQFKVKS